MIERWVFFSLDFFFFLFLFVILGLVMFDIFVFRVKSFLGFINIFFLVFGLFLVNELLFVILVFFFVIMEDLLEIDFFFFLFFFEK